MYVSGVSEDCECVLALGFSLRDRFSNILECRGRLSLVGSTAYNTYDAYFCQSDVELTISDLIYTDVTIHIYNFGTNNETLIEPNSATNGSVWR